MFIGFRIDGAWCERKRLSIPKRRCERFCRGVIGSDTTACWSLSARRFASPSRRGARDARLSICARESESHTRAEHRVHGLAHESKMAAKLKCCREEPHCLSGMQRRDHASACFVRAYLLFFLSRWSVSCGLKELPTRSIFTKSRSIR